MGPQPSSGPERKPMGLCPEELTPPGQPEQVPLEQMDQMGEQLPPQEGPEEEKPAPAYRLNTVAGSGNTTNNPDNNIVSRTLEEGAGIER